MRELTMDEVACVAGGDETDYNEVGCETAVGATLGVISYYSGPLYASAYGTLVPAATVVCQMTTSSLGTAAGELAADAVIASEELAASLGYYYDELKMISKWYTGGL